jgi:galactokinase/mevalonate kinase-like predicted kinase
VAAEAASSRTGVEPHRRRLYDTAIRAGAIGGKLLGAGGGGFMLLFAPPDAQPRIQYALRNLISRARSVRVRPARASCSISRTGCK